MRITTRGQLAVSAMTDLALRQNNGPVTLAAISQRQQISLSYLEQLFSQLRRAGLVESIRGPGGGYTLGFRGDGISVADIIGEITAASGEQSSGIGQVNTAVNQLDQMTQQNAALVEQSTAAAESLKSQAEQLSQAVRVFKTASV